jgi:hypothetical protein
MPRKFLDKAASLKLKKLLKAQTPPPTIDILELKIPPNYFLALPRAGPLFGAALR